MSSDRPYLPCFSMVATGTCCHGFRCKFIHDPRILMRPVKLRKQIEAFMIKRVAYYNENLRNKVNKYDNSNAKDIFFWPAMGNEKETPQQDVYNPQWSSNTRFYEPGNGMDGSYERQISMWNHFVCTCGSTDVKENEGYANTIGGNNGSNASNGNSNSGGNVANMTMMTVPKVVVSNDNRLPIFSQLTGIEHSVSTNSFIMMSSGSSTTGGVSSGSNTSRSSPIGFVTSPSPPPFSIQ